MKKLFMLLFLVLLGAQAVTAQTTVTLSVISEYDTPNPPVGINEFASGTEVNAFVADDFVSNGTTGQQCTGWIGEGSVPTSGTLAQAIFTIDEDSTITWQWETRYYVATNAIPEEGGVVKPESSWIAQDEPIELCATANPGFVFVGWDIDDDGNIDLSDNPTTTVITQAEKFTGYFEKEVTKFSLEINSEYGNPEPPVGVSEFTSGTLINASVEQLIEETNGEIRHICTGFEGQGDDELTSGGTTNNVSFTINEDSAITWLWKNQFKISASAEPEEGGSVSFDSKFADENSEEEIFAETNEGWQFDGWDTTCDGVADIFDNPIKIVADSPKTIKALFSEKGEKFSLVIISEKGKPTPTVGEHKFTSGTLVKAFVEPAIVSGEAGERFVCIGFNGKGDFEIADSHTSTTVTFTIDTDSTITWEWLTQYQLSTIAANQGGIIEPATAWVDANSTITITATPFEGFQFDGWDFDGDGLADATDNPVIIAIDAPKTVTALFSAQGNYIQKWDFTDGDQGWLPNDPISGFDQPQTEIKDGAIGISANGSNNCFGFWTSPAVPMDTDKKYKARYFLYTDETESDNVPLIRLRANISPSFGRSWYTTVESQNGASLTPSVKEYPMYIIPNLPSIPAKGKAIPDSLVFSYDLLSFNPNDNSNAWIYCDSVVVEEVDVLSVTTVAQYEFNESEDGWIFSGALPGLSEAQQLISPSGIGLSPNGSPNCFGFWMSPDITVEKDKLYRATYSVSSNNDSPQTTPQFRLRVAEPENWRGWMTTVDSADGQTPYNGYSLDYSVLFDPQTTKDSTTANLAFDIMSFNTDDNTAAELYLESAMLEEIEVIPVTPIVPVK